jgi:multicomponent Na+:H+ antiporter subunit G
MMKTAIDILLVVGCFAVFLAALGVVRLPDFFARIHAATKASAFGIALLLVATCLAFPDSKTVLKSAVALVALFLTLPVASQALADVVRRRGD